MGEIENTTEIVKKDSVEVSVDNEKSSFKGQLGGARPGAGRKPGGYNKKTLDAMKMKQHWQQRTMNHLDELFNAQMSLAKGTQSVYVTVTTKKNGKSIRNTEMVTDPEQIKDYINYIEGISDNPSDDENYYFMTTAPPNNMALDSLLNRTLGKVPEKLEVEGGFFRQDVLNVRVIGEEVSDESTTPREGDGGGEGTESVEETEVST